MEMNANAICSLQPRIEVKLATNRFYNVEKWHRCFFQPAQRVPNRRRLYQARAEDRYGRSRASSSMPETERRRRNTYRDAEEADSVSVWDSNAEGIRGSWGRANRTSSGSKPVRDHPDAYASEREDGWQWWRSGPDDDDYEGDADADEEDPWFNFDNFDVFSAISMLRWMVPAAALILPWLFGGPVFLMMAFAFFPIIQKLLGLFVPRAWKEALQGSSPRSRRKNSKKWGFWKQHKDDPFTGSKQESDFFNSDVEDWEEAFLCSSIEREAASKLGGWGEKNKMSIQKSATRRKKAALEKRRSSREVPLFFRLLVALFPFLRSWGGFL